MNVKLLKSKMVLKGDTFSDLASILGVWRSTLSGWIRGSNFPSTAINDIKKRYNLTPDEVDAIFFNENEDVV